LGRSSAADPPCGGGGVGEADHGATARVWLADDTMAFDPDSGVAPAPQPGINGVRYGPKTGYLYYTSTAHHGPFGKIKIFFPNGPWRLSSGGRASR
jgi:hypothetical protein